jgi:hypothetical protein
VRPPLDFAVARASAKIVEMSASRRRQVLRISEKDAESIQMEDIHAVWIKIHAPLGLKDDLHRLPRIVMNGFE